MNFITTIQKLVCIQTILFCLWIWVLTEDYYYCTELEDGFEMNY